MTSADPTLNALLVATALEDWPAWYGCTRLALADYLEERDLPGDRQAAGLVRAALPTAWARCPVRPGWEVDEVGLYRGGTIPPLPSWVRVAVAGHGRDDDGFSRLAEQELWPGVLRTLSGDCLRPFPLRVLRLSAVIPDGSEVSAGVSLRHGHPVHALVYGRYDLKLTPRDARLWCRREVLGLFPGVSVRAPCPHCGGRGKDDPRRFFVDEAAGRGVMRLRHPLPAAPCPVCRGRRPRPCPAPSLLPTLPAVALPALAPLN